MPRHVGFSIRGYRPSLPSHHYYGRTTAFAVVMAQNRFSIFCRRKTTERDEEGRRKKGGDRSQDGIGYIGLLLLLGEEKQAGRYVAIGREEKGGKAVFWRHLGVMMGNIPYYGKQIGRTHSLVLRGLLGGLS